jgi:raffinose/stachyose/melibiose transport system substrate-binding protein
VNSQASAKDQEASIKLLEWLFGTAGGKKNVLEKLGFVAPFSTFGPAERPGDPLVREMFRYLDDPAIVSVSWDFLTFPSQEFKNTLGANLYAYALDQLKWEELTKKTVESWASEKAALR